jgi:RNA polymerase sigma-70 factor (ECF subfamily)
MNKDMNNPANTDLTATLTAATAGDQKAADQLMPVVYAELRRLAGIYLSRERGDHTLQPTALVHEAYLRLVDQTRVVWKNRAHFMGVAAQAMRRILVDHARKRAAMKRAGDMQKVTLDTALTIGKDAVQPDLIALDMALDRLAVEHPEKAQVVVMRFFGGLKEADIAEVLNISSRTVTRYWKYASAWLARDLSTES